MQNYSSEYLKETAGKTDIYGRGNLKGPDLSTGPTSLPSFGFDPRRYQASSSTLPTSNSAHLSHSAAVELSKAVVNSPSHPTRPNHLGPSFVSQTQFLTVNVNHGTPGSDKESTHSSTSPLHVSPYTIGRHSRSPSPFDKSKIKTDNTCPQCGKQFSSSSALAKHKLIHSDERKYACHICSRGFKRQDHLNGHMITHRDKKPYECHFPECGKSYCDMRSLRRHLENHHSSPPGGATPGSYMPKLMSLYPNYSEEDVKNQAHSPFQQESISNRLSVPVGPQRPSSAPLVPPEPKRITRNRRSSSGEESSIHLDPAIMREIESRKAEVYRQERQVSDEYVKPRDNRLAMPHTSQLSPVSSSHLLTTVPHSEYESHRNEYNREIQKRVEMERAYDRRIEQSKLLSEHDTQHSHRELKQTLSNERPKSFQDLSRPKTLHKDYENGPKKHTSLPSAFQQGMPPHILNSRFPWGQYPGSQSGPSAATANMPFLLNIRNPFGFPPRGMYPGQSETPVSDSKLSKSEQEARNQAMNTYLQMWANGQRGSLTPEQLFMYSQNHLMSGQSMSTPTDPTAIAIAAAKEHGERPSFNVHDGFYGIHPTNAQWQPVMQDDSITREKDSKPSFYHHPPVSSSHDNNNFLKRPVKHEHHYQERNIIDEPFKPSESNHREFYKYTRSPQGQYYERNRPLDHSQSLDRANTYEPPHLERTECPCPLEPPRHLDVSHSPHRYEHAHNLNQRETITKIFEPPTLHIQTSDNLPTPALSPNKKRNRPGPIIIPPAVNNRAYPSSKSPVKVIQSMNKVIYTPPAMLSPRSIFFNPPIPAPRVSLPSTPGGRYFLNIRRSTSIDQREAPLPTSTLSSEEAVSTEIPEPKINVGPQFQAPLPNLLNRVEAQKDIHKASLMWSPIKEDQQKCDEVNAYLDMACSLALYGGSNNKEYALHILQRTRGNVKEAVRLLLSRRHILRADDPNADYHYSGSVRWTAKERLAFRQAYRTKGKVFVNIQKEVITKSVQLCVEFYYLWKAMHPESFRARTRMVEVESEQDDEEVPPTPTAAVAPLSTLREPVFECDYPECRARFVSRQALNGHIRVHGGSFSKPQTEVRRPKQKSVVLLSPEMLSVSMTRPPKKKKTTPPTSVIVTSEGPQLQFQCKVCGRVFSKVKSRSAHMKTHVKRDDNNKPIKRPKQPKHAVNPMTVYAHA